MSCAKRSDGRGGSFEKYEIYIAVVIEYCGDRQSGDQVTVEAVDKDIVLLYLVLDEFTVNGRAVEVVVSDVAFE